MLVLWVIMAVIIRIIVASVLNSARYVLNTIEVE